MKSRVATITKLFKMDDIDQTLSSMSLTDFATTVWILIIPITNFPASILENKLGVDKATPVMSFPGHSCFTCKLQGQNHLDYLEKAGWSVYNNDQGE